MLFLSPGSGLNVGPVNINHSMTLQVGVRATDLNELQPLDGTRMLNNKMLQLEGETSCSKPFLCRNRQNHA